VDDNSIGEVGDEAGDTDAADVLEQRAPSVTVTVTVC
jgi:hypothetical protein